MADNTEQSEQNAQPNESTSNGNGNGSNPATAELENKLKEQEQKYVYLYADFENFKKRAFRERQDIVKFGWENVASGLLEVLDNLDRAIQHAGANTDPNLMAGLKMVQQQFKSTMEKNAVAEIPTIGQPFNPELHEAVGQIPSDKPAGIIVQEQQKGYTLHGRLLRPSRVLISTGQPAH